MNRIIIKKYFNITIRILLLLFILSLIALEFKKGIGEKSIGIENKDKDIHGLYVDETELDLGDTFCNDSFEHEFTIHNRNSTSVEIESWSTSCNCSVLEPKSTVIPAYSSAIIKGKIFLTNRNNTYTNKPISVEVLYKPIIKGNNDNNGISTDDGWIVRAHILPVLIGTRYIYLDRIVKCNLQNANHVYTWKLANDWTVSSVSCIDDCLSIERIEEKGNTLTLSIFTNNQNLGKHNSQILVQLESGGKRSDIIINVDYIASPNFHIVNNADYTNILNGICSYLVLSRCESKITSVEVFTSPSTNYFYLNFGTSILIYFHNSNFDPATILVNNQELSFIPGL